MIRTCPWPAGAAGSRLDRKPRAQRTAESEARAAAPTWTSRATWRREVSGHPPISRMAAAGSLESGIPTSNEDERMGLTACLYCKAVISRAAKSCPACRAAIPTGVPCSFCGQSVRAEDAVRFDSPLVMPPLFKGAAHLSCVEKYWSLPRHLICRDCKTPLSETLRPIESLNLPHASCGKCGCATPLGFYLPDCYYCGRAILASHRQGAMQEVDCGSDGPSQYKGCHDFCQSAQPLINAFYKAWTGF